MEYQPQIRPRGPKHAKVLVVGEAPGEREVEAGVPFIGPSGKEMGRMLREAGIREEDCRFTNMINMRPPNNDVEKFFFTSKKKSNEGGGVYHWGRYCVPAILDGLEDLRKEVESCNPNLIIALGNSGLWATTGNKGITKWRGSELESTVLTRGTTGYKVIPTYHPANILRVYENRFIAVEDLRRCRREAATPEVYEQPYNFILRPSAQTALDVIRMLMEQVKQKPTKLAVDVETRNRQIACIGLAWSSLDAICIPVQSVDDVAGSYFSPGEETEIIWQLNKLLRHPNCLVIGQNFNYDNQYFARNYGFRCNLQEDTMLQQHVAWPGLPKSLDFISSMYREHHRYWKDDGKNWDPRTTDENQLWYYNCEDAVATYESHFALVKVLDYFKLQDQYREKMLVAYYAFDMMLRGVNSNMKAKLELSSELGFAIAKYREWLLKVIGYDVFGPKAVSPKKMMHLAYEVLKLPPKFVKTKEGRRKTANKDAIAEWLETCEPVFRPILHVIEDVRSMQVFKSTFADQELDWDNRFRCSNNVAGAHTMRWSTSEDAFNYGGNLQNIPKGDDR